MNEPGEVDAFGILFNMEDRGKLVRCHVFRAAMDRVEDHASQDSDELIARFQKSRRMFEQLASNLYDAGHRTPWIDAYLGRAPEWSDSE